MSGFPAGKNTTEFPKVFNIPIPWATTLTSALAEAQKRLSWDAKKGPGSDGIPCPSEQFVPICVAADSSH